MFELRVWNLVWSVFFVFQFLLSMSSLRYNDVLPVMILPKYVKLVKSSCTFNTWSLLRFAAVAPNASDFRLLMLLKL